VPRSFLGCTIENQASVPSWAVAIQHHRVSFVSGAGEDDTWKQKENLAENRAIDSVLHRLPCIVFGQPSSASHTDETTTTTASMAATVVNQTSNCTSSQTVDAAVNPPFVEPPPTPPPTPLPTPLPNQPPNQNAHPKAIFGRCRSTSPGCGCGIVPLWKPD
jgi:hypothetical protein